MRAVTYHHGDHAKGEKQMDNYKESIAFEEMYETIARTVGTHMAPDPDDGGELCEWKNPVTLEMLPKIAKAIVRKCIEREPWGTVDAVAEEFSIPVDMAVKLADIVDEFIDSAMTAFLDAARKMGV